MKIEDRLQRLPHGVFCFLPNDELDERKPEIAELHGGVLIWLPYNQKSPAKLHKVETEIGTVCYAEDPQGIEQSFGKALRAELETLERNDSFGVTRLIVTRYLLRLLPYCFKDAAHQAVRELLSLAEIVKTFSQVKRNRITQQVSEWARQASYRRFVAAGFARKLKQGEHDFDPDNLSFDDFVEEWFSPIETAIAELVSEMGDTNITLRDLARKLRLGVEHQDRSRDTGIKMLERLLKDRYPSFGQTPKQIMDSLIEKAKVQGGLTQGGKANKKKNSRGKSK